MRYLLATALLLLLPAGCGGQIVITPDVATRSWNGGAAIPVIEHAARWWEPVGVYIVIRDGGVPFRAFTGEQWQTEMTDPERGWIAASGPGGINFNDSVWPWLSDHGALEEAFAHEMGHVFGLGHDVAHPDAVMWPTPHAASGITTWDVDLFKNGPRF